MGVGVGVGMINNLSANPVCPKDVHVLDKPLPHTLIKMSFLRQSDANGRFSAPINRDIRAVLTDQ